MKDRQKFWVLGWALASAAALVAMPAAASDTPNAPTGEIEAYYYEEGPWEVTRDDHALCCDSSGAELALWYPTDLGAGGAVHPIITWGNGTGAAPEQYDYLLRHLASWGFVVVASRNPNTGVGTEILDAAHLLAEQGEDPASPFYGALDAGHVGAMGHSQGATGALNAMRLSGGFIQTAIPIELPSQRWCGSEENCFDASSLTHGSVFYINGDADVLISPSHQARPWTRIGQQSIAGYYAATPASVEKLWGTLIGPNHNDVQGQPACLSSVSCTYGVYGYLGYPTAWMMDRLQGVAWAHGAFIEGEGEIFWQSTNWENQASNVP